MIFHFFPADDTRGQEKSLQRQQDLQQRFDIDARTLSVAASESLKSKVPEGFVVYLDRFQSREAALAFCAERTQELAAEGHSCAVR